MKLYEIINAIPALNKLGNSDMQMAMAYKLQKLLTAIQTEISFFNTNQLKIIQEHGVIKDNGEFIIDEDKREVYAKVMDELAQTDVEPVFNKMKIAVIENIQISANDVGALMPFVEFMEGE